MAGTGGVEWFEPREKLEAALVQALKSNDTWDGAALQVLRSLGGEEKELYEYPLEDSLWRPQAVFEFAPVESAEPRWGLTIRTVGDHAFLLHHVDDAPTYTRTVRAWWTPADDRAQLERTVLAHWVSHWREDRLLPIGGPMSRLSWDGPDEYRLAFDCLDALLETDDDAWGMFVAQLDEMLEALELQVARGFLLDTLGGSAPSPSHDVSWLESVVRGRQSEAVRTEATARRSLISYYLKPNSVPVSHWRRVIDACPHRARHLHEAVEAQIAAQGECLLDEDLAMGMDAVFRCLAHTFRMNPEDLEELRAEAETEVDRYIGSWGPALLPPGAAPYPGGHPRVAAGDREGEFYSTFDIGELVESRGRELANCLDVGCPVWVEFEVERPDHEVGESMTSGEIEFEWSLNFDEKRSGDAGYWTMEYYNGNAERRIDVAISTWRPFEDQGSRRRAFIDGFGGWWGQLEDYTIGADTWRATVNEPVLVVDAIADLCVRSGHWWDSVLTVAIERAGDRSRLEEGLWAARGCESPGDSWWDSPSNEAANNRRHEVRFVRELAAFYEMHFLERLLDNDDNKASVEDAEA